MADKVVPGPVEGSAAVREAVCIHTRKIFDACRDKDCVEDLRVYPTVSSQTKLDSALSVRPRSAELLCADVRVKEITFNKGYYTVDVTYFYRVRGETFPGCEPVSGLAIFDKRVMLFGSQASVKVFASDGGGCAPCEEGLPVGVVESVDRAAHEARRLCRRRRDRPRGAHHSAGDPRRDGRGALAHLQRQEAARDARAVFDHPARARHAAAHPGI